MSWTTFGTVVLYTLGFAAFVVVTSLVYAFFIGVCEALRSPSKKQSNHPDTPDTPAATPTNTSPQSEAPPAYVATRPRYTLKSVIGMTETTGKLMAAMREALNNSNPRRPPRNGILLHGRPGGGKTFLVEAVAGELGLGFLSVSYAQLNSKWVGNTTENVASLFSAAIAQAPCVLFLDEVEALLVPRNQVVQAESESAKTVAALLTLTEQLRGQGVVLVAATNFIDRLDPAAIREGRFDYKIMIPMPDLPARIALLSSELGRIAPSEADLWRLAVRWEGFSVARLRGIAQESVKMAKRRQLTAEDIMAAYLRVRGRVGVVLPENTPTLAGLTLPEATADNLSGLARRMLNPVATEAKGGTIPKGVLFHGAPGTGKSLAARALAKTTGWSFLVTTGPDLIEDPDAIDRLLDQALDARPAIVFIDEADDLLMDRTNSWHRAAANRWLAAMDGAERTLHDVVFLAATNHPEALDAAMLRGGRFGQKIAFSLPDYAAMANFVACWLTKTPCRLGHGITINGLAKRMIGLSLADATEVLNGAVNRAIDTDPRSVLRPTHVQQALTDIGQPPTQHSPLRVVNGASR